MKNIILDIIIVFICFSSLGSSFGEGVKPDEGSVPHGVSVGNSVSNGFVFINGKYINLPYVVSRRGLGVYINDELVAGPFGELEKYDVEIDPEIPKGIGAKSSFDDIKNYLTLKLRFLCTNRSDKNLVQEYIDSVQRLPCIEKIEIIAADKINVYFRSGEMIPMFVRPPSERSVLASRGDVILRVEAMRANYEEKLSEGRCYIFNKDKGTLMLTREKAYEVLSENFSDAAIVAGTNGQQKASRLGADDVPYKFYMNLQSSTQLNERLKKENQRKAEK